MAKIYERSEAALKLLKTHKPIIVYDTETTGLNAQSDYVIQFSGALYTWDEEKKNYVRTASLEQYIKPPLPISDTIINLTGITNGYLSGAPSEEQVFPIIKAFMDLGEIFVAYNNQFDDGMLTSMYLRNHEVFLTENRIDVLKIARELINKNDLYAKSYKLMNVAEYYKVAVEGFHNASVDILNTWKVLLAEMRDYASAEKSANGIKDFRINNMNRWQKSYGRNSRFDRMYIYTNLGIVVYDFVNNELQPKEENGPSLDPQELVLKANEFAQKNGYENFWKYKK